jgi:NADH dehydrogenase
MILITGATGYIGCYLVSRLVVRGDRPRCLVRNIDRATQILPADEVDLVLGDTIKPDSLTAAVRGIDTIVHAAFITADRKEVPGTSRVPCSPFCYFPWHSIM